MNDVIKDVHKGLDFDQRFLGTGGHVTVSTNFNTIKIADVIFHPTALYDANEYDEFGALIRPDNLPNFEEINSLRGPDSIMAVGTITYGPTFEQHVEKYDNRASIVGASKYRVV